MTHKGNYAGHWQASSHTPIRSGREAFSLPTLIVSPARLPNSIKSMPVLSNPQNSPENHECSISYSFEP